MTVGELITALRGIDPSIIVLHEYEGRNYVLDDIWVRNVKPTKDPDEFDTTEDTSAPLAVIL